MMISPSTPSTPFNPDEKLTMASLDTLSADDEEDREPSLTPSPEDKNEEALELPEPDSDNITVLTDKLPNKPILPWNRYDSPWETEETSELSEDAAEISVNDEESPLT